MQIKEAFKKFTEERHKEDKGKNHDMLQEIYASTEFFDISLIDKGYSTLNNFKQIEKDNTYKADFPIEAFCLPFSNAWVKLNEDTFVFIREYSPEIIIGTVYTVDLTKEIELKRGTYKLSGTFNVPFTIHNTGFLPYITSGLELMSHVDVEGIIYTTMLMGIRVCEVLNNLSKKQVAVDTDTSGHHEYYRRKRKPTIKIPVRPIYYVLGDKKENVTKKYNSIKSMGKLEYSHSFKVRGHWRRIDEKSLGKDRNGNYGVHGYTWVVEHIRGEGELTKRLRVVKA